MSLDRLSPIISEVCLYGAPSCWKAMSKISGRGLVTPTSDEITTTFASSYGVRLSLEDALDPEQVRRYGQMATGDKALVRPNS